MEEECPIYIINLKNKEKNLIRTIREIRKLEIFNNIIVHEATDIDKAKESQKYISKKALTNINNIKSQNIIPTWGAVGCALSHRDCWIDINKKGYDYAIICEDDIKINNIDNLKHNYYECKKLYKLSKYNFNGIFITLNSKMSTYNQVTCSESIYGSFTGMSFYLIDKLCAEKLGCIFPITNQIDMEIGLNMYNLNIIMYNKTGTDEDIGYYNHISSVQYYFICYNELLHSLSILFPNEIIGRIYYYLPKKEDMQNDEFEDNGYNMSH